MKLILVSGMSGAGKSIVLKSLEDLDFFCIDNLPLELLVSLVNWHRKKGEIKRLAVSIDSRSQSNFENLSDILSQLEIAKGDIHFLFLETRDSILLKRFSETGRIHPLVTSKRTLQEAIILERKELYLFKEQALVLDTSYLLPQNLRQWVQEWIGLSNKSFRLVLKSFGFKYGVPTDIDFLFDVRCLPNPFYFNELRDLTGRDKAIIEYFSHYPEVEKMILSIQNFLESWITSFRKASRNNLTIGIGCTGGMHRSVYVVESLAKQFSEKYSVLIQHRQLHQPISER